MSQIKESPAQVSAWPPADSGADNSGVFAGSEFALWAHRSELEPGEYFVTERYLSKIGRTLEAGCGGGRLLLDLQARGFTDLHGFDYLPEFVEVARARDISGNIDYQVQNAIHLDYPSDNFDQAMYLQQVLCFLPDNADRASAVREAFRVLRPGGVLVTSLLSYRARAQSPVYGAYLTYLHALRSITRQQRSPQSLPWLRRNNRMNWGAFADRGPYMYWFRDREATELFTAAGFEIAAVGSDAQVPAGHFLESIEELGSAPFSGRLYLICRKPR